jgi:predicted TPR repeat methyltransferase
MVPADLFALALSKQKAGDIGAAESLFRQVLAHDPRHGDAALNLCVLLLTMGRPGEAADYAENAVRLNPTSASAHHYLGLAWRRQGRPQAALVHCRLAVTLQPDNPACRENLAAALAELGERTAAMEEYRQAIALEPLQPRPHNNLGTLCANSGDWPAAEACYRAALALRPDYVEALRNLATLLGQQGNVVEAAECARRLLALRPEETAAQFLFAALTGENQPAMPTPVIAAFFDQYAPAFDAHMRALKYSGPQMLREAIRNVPGPFDILDLGCGTGACGTVFRDLARTLTGVDASARMLACARSSGCYDRLVQGDLIDALKESDAAYDLILGADVFIYVGDLSNVFPAAYNALRPGGHFVFVVEAGDGEDFVLRLSRRYAHSPSYVRKLATFSGLLERAATRGFLRLENDRPIEGDAYLLEKPRRI